MFTKFKRRAPGRVWEGPGKGFWGQLWGKGVHPEVCERKSNLHGDLGLINGLVLPIQKTSIWKDGGRGMVSGIGDL